MNAFAFILFILNVPGGADSTRVPECRKFEEKLYLQSVLNKKGNPSGFIDSLKGCMTESPELNMALGKYYYNRNDFKSAQRELNKIITSGQANKDLLANSYYYLSLCAYYTADYETSIECSEKSLKNGFTPSTWCYNNIGLALSKQKKEQKAIEYYNKALEANPRYVAAVNNIGSSYNREHKYAEALKYFRRADSIVNGNSALYTSNIIWTLEELDRYPEADTLSVKAYKKFPGEKYIIFCYAGVLRRMQKYDEVLSFARRLLKMHPDDGEDWFQVAYTYEAGGEEDSAFYYYNIALKYNPNMANAHHNIGLIYKTKGLFEKAHAKYDIALSLDSSSHYYYRSKSFAYLWQHDFENSYRWALKFYKRFPEQDDGPSNLGYMLLQLKRYEEAIVFCRKRLVLTPKDDRVLNNIGRCYAGLKQTDSAFYYFTAALKSNPENSYIYHNRAALYCDLGKYDLACADLKTAMDKEYTWIIDEKLETMKKNHCPAVNTNRKVLIHEYKGNSKNLSRFSFIQLSDSSLSQSINTIVAAENKEIKMGKEEKETSSSFFDSFTVFPNPSSGKFQVSGTASHANPLQVKVYNESGALLLNEAWTEKSNKEMELKNVSPGIYVVMILDNNSVLSAKKLIIQ